MSLGFFIDIILPASIRLWGSPQTLTKMSTRGFSYGVKAAGAQGCLPYNRHVPTVLKSGSLNFLEP